MQAQVKMSEVIARANAINLEKLLLLVSKERGARNSGDALGFNLAILLYIDHNVLLTYLCVLLTQTEFIRISRPVR